MTREHSSSRTRGLAGLAVGIATVAVVAMAPLLIGQDAAPPRSSTSEPTPAERAAIEDAERIGDAFAALAEQVSPSVVSIRVEARLDVPAISLPFGLFPGLPREGDQQFVHGAGSGFLITDDGAIVTNGHVVEHATRIRVRLQDGRDLPGTVVGIDRATDLAVVRVPARGLTPLRLADPERQRVGQWVVAIGSPFGLDMTVTAGVLSAIGRGGLGINEIEDFVQTDASINPGNSGGPLVNLDGEVVGVNSVVVGRGQGIGFAIPADIVENVATQLLEHGRVPRAWIGAGFQRLTPELANELGAGDRHGALVTETVPGGPASEGGLVAGDIVVAIDGAPVDDSHDLMRRVLRQAIGAHVRLDVVRNGRSRRVTVTTGERPDSSLEAAQPTDASRPRAEDAGLGVEWLALTPEIARQLEHQGTDGAVVAHVVPGSAGDRAGLARGDIVIEADRRTVASPAEVERALADGHALLRVARGPRSFYTVLQRE